MHALIATEPGTVVWQDVPDPTPSPDGVVVRPLAVSRCDLDAPMAAYGLFPHPIAVGHEAVGVVTAVGAEVTRWREGDRALVPFQVSCGACRSCQRQAFAACDTHRAPAGAAFGFGQAGGGHAGAVADLLAVPHADHLLVAVPDEIPDAQACLLADNVVDGWRAVAPGLRAEPGADVLVVGGLARFVGVVAAWAAGGLGAGRVTVVDDDADRLADAEAVGATVIDATGGWPDRLPKAAVTVENTGTPDGLERCLRATEPYGTCTSVAIHFSSPVPMPLLQMYTRGVTFHTSRADARRLLPDLLGDLADAPLDLSVLPTDQVPWEEADRRWLSPGGKLVLVR